MVYPAREAPAHYHHGLPVRDEYFVVQPEIQRQAIAPLRPRLKLEAAQAFIFADNIRGIALGREPDFGGVILDPRVKPIY